MQIHGDVGAVGCCECQLYFSWGGSLEAKRRHSDGCGSVSKAKYSGRCAMTRRRRHAVGARGKMDRGGLKKKPNPKLPGDTNIITEGLGRELMSPPPPTASLMGGAEICMMRRRSHDFFFFFFACVNMDVRRAH